MKAILMLEEMPFCCELCYMSMQVKQGRLCTATRKKEGGIMINACFGTKPSWCPLVEVNDKIAKLIEVAR